MKKFLNTLALVSFLFIASTTSVYAEVPNCGTDTNPGVPTAIGCVYFGDTNILAASMVSIAIGISGAIALVMIAIAAYHIMTSQGNPQQLQSAKDALMSAVSGLILIALSAFVLRLIGVDVLGLFPAL